MTKFPFLVWIIAVTFALPVSLAGCRSPEKRVAVFLYNRADPFIESMYGEMEKQLAGTIYQLDSYDARNSQVLQNEQIEGMLDDPVDMVILNGVDRLGVYPIIRKMKDEDIPVIFYNREPLAKDLALWDRCFYVGATAEQSGRLQARLLIELFGGEPDNLNHFDRNGDGRIQCVIIRGEQAHQDSEIRTREVRTTFAQEGYSLELLTSLVANWNRKEAYDKFDEVLNLYGGEIEVVISNNDEMALGAIEKMTERGFFGDADGNGKIDREDDDWIPVVGIDGLQAALDSIEEGYLYGTVINDATTQARAIVDLAGTILSGRDPAESSYELVDGTYIWNDYYPYLSD